MYSYSTVQFGNIFFNSDLINDGIVKQVLRLSLMLYILDKVSVEVVLHLKNIYRYSGAQRKKRANSFHMPTWEALLAQLSHILYVGKL